MTEVHRPSAAVYLPELIAKVVQRYHFVQGPTAEQLLKSEIVFQIGKFDDVGIGEMRIYNDGVIVSGGSNTDYLEAFLNDLLEWAKTDFGLVPIVTVKPELHFESLFYVKSDADLLSLIRPEKAAVTAINRLWAQYPYGGEYELISAHFNIDPPNVKARRKPQQFIIERRAGTAAEENIYYSVAPFKTKDHLALLERLEALVRG